MGHGKSPKELAKYLAYVLGRRPDEFGVIPDADGWVKIKDLLKALAEEEEFRYVRQASIHEVILTTPVPPVEIQDVRIRARDRSQLIRPEPAMEMPKLLYTCVRHKAHPVVLERGITPVGGHPHVVLSPDEFMALRMGRRLDADPLLLTILVQRAVERGVLFQHFGPLLFLTRSLPVGTFVAPPLPDMKEDVTGDTEKKERKQKMPGSYLVNIENTEEKREIRYQRKKKEIGREKDRKRERKQKGNLWR